MAPNRREKEKNKRRRADARKIEADRGKGYEATCVKIPENCEWWKIEKSDSKPGSHKVDFMPYVCGTLNNKADEGMEHYMLDYEVHKIPVPGKDFASTFICRRAFFGKKCGCCDWLTKKGGSADPEFVKKLRPQLRHLFLVNEMPGSPFGEKNKVKVFDTNHYAKGRGFGEQLGTALGIDEENGTFWYPEAGKSLILTTSHDTFPGGGWNPVTRIDFTQRKKQYSEDIAEEMPSLEEMIIDPGFEKIWDLLEGGGEEETETEETETEPEDEIEEEETPKAKVGKKKAKPDPEEEESEDDSGEDDSPKCEFKVDDLVEYEGQECKVLRVSKDGTSLMLEDQDGDPIKAVNPDDCKAFESPSDDDDPEEEEEKPKKKKNEVTKVKVQGQKRTIVKEDDDDVDSDDDEPEEGSDIDTPDEDEDDEPPPPKKKK